MSTELAVDGFYVRGSAANSLKALPIPLSSYSLPLLAHAGIERIQISKVRFARDGSGDLLTLLNTPATGGHVARWSGAPSLLAPAPPSGPDAAAGAPAPPPRLLSLVSCKKVSEHPCTCFEVSRDGTLLAFGTSEGAVVVSVWEACGNGVRGGKGRKGPSEQFLPPRLSIIRQAWRNTAPPAKNQQPCLYKNLPSSILPPLAAPHSQ